MADQPSRVFADRGSYAAGRDINNYGLDEEQVAALVAKAVAKDSQIAGSVELLTARADEITAMRAQLEELLRRSSDAPNARSELADLAGLSNLSAEAEACRAAAEAAMTSNELAEALSHLQRATELEARASAAATRRADRLAIEAVDAHETASVHQFAHARALAAQAAILLEMRRFEDSIAVYTDAIASLPSDEADRAAAYARRQRVALNIWLNAEHDLRALRAIAFGSTSAAPPDVFTYSILIARAPTWPEARAILDEMRQHGVEPDVVTWSTLAACAPTWPEARAILDEMRQHGVEPDVVTWSTLAARAPTWPEARAILDEMRQHGVEPNVVTWSTLAACAPTWPEARAILDEMRQHGVEPDVVTWSTLAARAPTWPEARAILDEMRQHGVEPNVVTWSTLAACAPTWPEARAILDEMRQHGVEPNVVTWSTLAACAPTWPEARAILDEMRQHGVEPDVVTWNTLAACAPTWPEARAILDEMRQHGVEPDVVTATTLASRVETPDQALELRDFMREIQLAGTEFHRAVFSRLRHSLSGQAMLDWAFSGGKGFPFEAIETPIAGYRRDGQLVDALRLVLGWPYFEASRRVLQDHPVEAEEFFLIRFEAGDEPHLASRALGFLYIEHGDVAKAQNWLQIARNHPDSTPASRRNVKADLAKLNAGFSGSP